MKIIKETIRDSYFRYGYYDHTGNFIFHNEDGPAIIDSDGSKRWYIHGNNITNEVQRWLNERNLDVDNLSEEDKFALSFYMESLCRDKINVHG